MSARRNQAMKRAMINSYRDDLESAAEMHATDFIELLNVLQANETLLNSGISAAELETLQQGLGEADLVGRYRTQLLEAG